MEIRTISGNISSRRSLPLFVVSTLNYIGNYRTAVSIGAICRLALGQMWEATRIGQQNVELLTDTGAHISWHQNVEEATEKGQKWSLEHELRTFITKPAGTRWDATAFAQTYPGENDSQPEGAGAPNGPPVWNNTPSPSFSTPISSSDSLLQYVSDPEGDALNFVNETGCTLLAVTTQNYSLLTAPTCGGVVAP